MDNILSMAGLALRAGRLEVGDEAASDACREKRCRLLLTACGQGQEAASRSDAEQSASSNQGQVASSSQMAPVEDVVDPDMVPIHAESL